MTKTTKYMLGMAALMGLSMSMMASAQAEGYYDYNPFNGDTQGAYIAGQAGGSFPDGDLDNDGSYALSLGYQFAPNIRAEVEGGYRKNDFSSALVNGDASTWTVMLNGFYDFKNETRFTPYLGGGIGWARSNLDGSVGGASFDESDNAFVYQVGGGASYALTESVAFTADYRWVDTGDFKYSAGGVSAKDDYSAHEVRAGLRYTF